MRTRRSRNRRGRARATSRTLWLALTGLLYVLAIPWYRSDEAPLRLWWGLPDWVAVALLCYGIAAIANVMAWRATALEDPAENPASEGGGSAPSAGPPP